MNNPMNEKETRAEFLKLGMSSEDIREIFIMFDEGPEYAVNYWKNLEVSRCVKE